VANAPEEIVAVARTREPAPAEAAVAAPVAVATRWVAESVDLAQADAAVLLEREMQEALGISKPAATFNTYSLANFAESAVTEPVDDEPIVSEVAAAEAAAQLTATSAVAEIQPAALAASASGDNASAGSVVAAPMAEGAIAAGAPSGFQDLRPVASAAGAGIAPEETPNGEVVRDPSAPEDEIDSRTKSQMDAAWSNWREIRNTIVTPNLTEQLAEVAAASVAASGKEERGLESGSSVNGAPDSASIASIVDSVLAEMRPKLVEEIARKLAARKE
jgi:hypothetical protein